MREEFFRKREKGYHELLALHFPALLEAIAAQKPSALVFVDSSARPFAYLTKKVWQELGFGKLPEIRFVAPVPGWVATAVKRKILAKELAPVLRRHRLALRKFAITQGWRGKKIVVFDDYMLQGHTMHLLKEELQSQGVVVKTAAFSAPAGFVDFAGISHAREPYWDAILTRQFGKPHVAPPNAVEKNGLAHLREKMDAVAEKIISERRKQ